MAGKWNSRRVAGVLAGLEMTVEELALRMSVSRQTIYNWLDDKHRISLVHRRQLERYERQIEKQKLKAAPA